MPEKDFVPGIGACWQPACRVLGGIGDPKEVAREVCRALPKQLKRQHGLQSLPELAQLLERVSAGQVDESAALDQLRQIECSWGNDQHTRIAVRAFKQVLTAREQLDLHSLRPAWIISLQFLRELVRSVFLDMALMRAVGRRFADPDDAEQFRDQFWSELQQPLLVFASDLARDPSAIKIRAPRGSLSRPRPLSEILDESVDA